MKITLIISATLLINSVSIAQKNCCAKTESTETFAMLIHNEKFIATHLDPLPFKFSSPMGKDISFKTKDGKEGYAYEIKASIPTH